MSSITKCDVCQKEIIAGDYCSIKGYSVKDDLDNLGENYEQFEIDLCYEHYQEIIKTYEKSTRKTTPDNHKAKSGDKKL